MYKFRVTVDDVKVAPSAKSEVGFANMDIRFLISDKTAGSEHPDGKAEEHDIAPGVAIFIPKNYIHWFRNPDPNEEVEICGVYSAPNAGDYRPEDYVYIGEITEKDKKIT
jgi:hypothetical protein